MTWWDVSFFHWTIRKAFGICRRTRLKPFNYSSRHKEILLYCIYIRTEDMYQKNLVAVILAVAALASVTTMNMVPSIYATSNGEARAPGQGEDSEGGTFHNNPSNNQPPPGNPDPCCSDNVANPGQCQKFLNGPAFDIEKEQAHNECHAKG
jgi:hypothetical protein